MVTQIWRHGLEMSHFLTENFQILTYSDFGSNQNTHFSRPYLVRSRLCVASVRLSSSSVSLSLYGIVAACVLVLKQKLLLTAYKEVVYEKSIGTKMNDLDLCLKVV